MKTRAIKGLLLAAFVAAGTGCPNVSFPVDSPNLRGITIPLPPPNWQDDPVQRFDIEGRLPTGYDSPGTEVFLYEQVTDRGYWTFADGQDFLVPDVLVDVTNNCIDTWFVDGETDDESTPTAYKVELSDEPDCELEENCSEPDDVGVCACLVEWTTGC